MDCKQNQACSAPVWQWAARWSGERRVSSLSERKLLLSAGLEAPTKNPVARVCRLIKEILVFRRRPKSFVVQVPSFPDKRQFHCIHRKCRHYVFRTSRLPLSVSRIGWIKLDGRSAWL